MPIACSEAQGDNMKAQHLRLASQPVEPPVDSGATAQQENGVGSMLLSGGLSAAHALGPIALKALMPMIP